MQIAKRSINHTAPDRRGEQRRDWDDAQHRPRFIGSRHSVSHDQLCLCRWRWWIHPSSL